MVWATLLIAWASEAQSQNHNKVDSLQNRLAKTKEDTLKVQLIAELARQFYYVDTRASKAYADTLYAFSKAKSNTMAEWEAYHIYGYLKYISGSYDSAVYFFDHALALSKDKAYDELRNFSLYWLGSCFIALSNYDKAAQYLNESFELSKRNHASKEMAKACQGLGVLYYTKSDYPVALRYYLQADSIYANAITMERGDLLQNIGMLYHVLDNSESEIDYYKRALEIYQKINDSYGISAIELRLGNYEKEAGKYDLAEKHFLAALPYFKQMQDEIKIGEVYQDLGSIFLLKKEFHMAANYFQNAIEKLEGAGGGNTMILRNAYRGYIEVQLALKNYATVEHKMQNFYEIVVNDSSIIANSDYFKLRAELDFAKGDYQNAFLALKQHKFYSDSLYAIKNAEVIHETEAKYQSARKQQEIELLTTQNLLQEQKQINQQRIYLFAIAGVLLLAMLMYFLMQTSKKSHKKLKEVDEMKSRFFSNISHEFRTPLTLIAGPIEHRLQQEDLPEKDLQTLGMVRNNARHLLALVDQLLDLSKIEAGAMKLHVAEGDIITQLHSLVDSFRYAAKEKSIDFTLDLPYSTSVVWYDAGIFHKIISNLLSNALKYTPQNGYISCSASVKRGQLICSIKNSGKGIDPNDLDKIFERFYQVNGNAPGVGIGLSLVKELVEKCKGTLSVISDQNVFTEFKLVLPVRRQDFKKDEIAESTNYISTQENFVVHPSRREDVLDEEVIDNDTPIILVVEDNAEIRKFIKSVLEPDYSILEAENGAIGWQKALDSIPDIIISDIMMPEMNGTELCKMVKEDERTSHIPVILLTAKAGDEHILHGYETGADDYILKPFSTDILKIRIEKLIELRKKLQEHYSQEIVLMPKEVPLSNADDKFIIKVKAIVDRRLTDSSFSAEVFSHEAGMSRMQLHRKMKALTGYSVNHFIRMQRLKLATVLLANDNNNISDVGYMAGFSDPSYFSKCFKAQFHCTPTEYAVQLKKTP